MSEFFLKIVNMSISASWIVLAVLLLRLLFKKAPKWINVVLWGIVGLRLVMPFSLESVFSLIPSAETVSPQIMTDKTPQINTGVPVINNVINPVISESFSPAPMDSANPLQIWIPILSILWIIGVLALIVYTAVSYWRVKRKIGTAVTLRDNIYQSENVVSPFVLGVIKPKIYLPFKMAEQDMEHVIAHEQAHIKRKDHLWKPLGFLILTLHWFNPLMWLGYVLLCRDIELACDEKVVKEFDNKQKADYSQALLTCSVNRRIIAACPLAFGEVGVKKRVKSVLNYKKPAFWIVVTAIVLSIVVAVCFLTNPATKLDEETSLFIEEQILEHHQGSYTNEEVSCTDFEVLHTKKSRNRITAYMWVLYQEYSLEDGKIEEGGGAYTPTVITVEKKNGEFSLVEYWEPGDGSYYVGDMVKKFPWHLYLTFDSKGNILDGQKYIEKLEANCLKAAKEYFSSSNIGGADPVRLSVSALRKIYPQFFNVSTDGGLTVYVWQMDENNYKCHLANTSMEAISDNSFAYSVWATIEEMKVILSSYDIDKNDITIQPVINPLSSYYYEITDVYKSKIKAMFFGNDGASIPKLSVTCNGAITEAVQGSSSWTYDMGNGMMQSIEANAAHPLNRIDYLLPLALKVKRYENTPLIAKLDFDIAPDNIKVNSWFLGENGKTKAFDAEVQGFDIKLNESKETCIYEIVATWNKNTKAYGTVTYSFAVVEAENLKYNSNIYTDDEIESAIKVIKADFKKDWKGCTLKKIAYLGDERLKNYQEFADRNNADDVLVLTSDFYVAPTGAHGSLNADSTYSDFKWILVRNKGEDWKHVDHGYP